MPDKNNQEYMMVLAFLFDDIQRRSAANSVELSVHKISECLELEVDECEWNFDIGANHTGPHRLNVHVGGFSARIYITEGELVAFWIDQPAKATQMRLVQELDQLRESIKGMSFPGTGADTDTYGWAPAYKNACFKQPRRRLSRKF